MNTAGLRKVDNYESVLAAAIKDEQHVDGVISNLLNCSRIPICRKSIVSNHDNPHYGEQTTNDGKFFKNHFYDAGFFGRPTQSFVKLLHTIRNIIMVFDRRFTLFKLFFGGILCSRLMKTNLDATLIKTKCGYYENES